MVEPSPFDETREMKGSSTSPKSVEDSLLPKQISRYRVQAQLGSGGFGIVYLAEDEQLNRLVAIKVPRTSLINDRESIETYLTEARTVANLDHPHIVPVYDVGSTEEFPCYIVSKYIEGETLTASLRKQRLSYHEAAQLVATIADALHYAHKQGLVHRDVKPSNILLGTDGHPYVVDFGLALKEENIGKGPNYAGTPAYMSPEQARGEGHRVDGRSDIFSLGVVFYFLLVRKLPFRGDSEAELLEKVTNYDPRPLRQYDEKLPKELERICNKALAKRVSERYPTAHDFAEDLKHFIEAHVEVNLTIKHNETETTQAVETSLTNSEQEPTQRDSSSKFIDPLGTPNNRIKVIPKGLRSFDQNDSEFFTELLAGPRGRDGLPDVLRFWKSKIEEHDPDQTFPVGLIYGPSGCGKSSLAKAGLLPRLSEDIQAIYLETTPGETEKRLLHHLQKHYPEIAVTESLKEAMSMIRRGEATTSGKKVVIFLDQFEQWLHGNSQVDNTELVQALRQCDGGKLQCILMVRDDFWMGVTRFLRNVEVRLIEGHNLSAVDLFPERHAVKVLAAFGSAYGALPENPNSLPKEQKKFLTESIRSLSEDGKVICVRLALFAEMMKEKPWTVSTLKEVGGTQGIGETFLEETFNSSAASPEHRFHQEAARKVLKKLLPESGTQIVGYMKTYDELLTASGYSKRPEDFKELIRILDHEIRLITPTDTQEVTDDAQEKTSVSPALKSYQLTHDYLVHSLTNWLTRKQQSTRQGRAELKLAERSSLWSAKSENRHLPSFLEFLRIRLLTDRSNWSANDKSMMIRAARFHGLRSLVLICILCSGLTGLLALNKSAIERQRAAEASRLVAGLLQAETSQVESIINDLEEYRTWAQKDLILAYQNSSIDSNAKLHAALALLTMDKSVLPFLKERLLAVSAAQFEYVRELLEQHKAEMIEDLWQITSEGQSDAEQRFRAGAALALYDSTNSKWAEAEFSIRMAQQLVDVLPSQLLPWRNALRPVKTRLVNPLTNIYRNSEEGEQARAFATDTLADYLQDSPSQLIELIKDANRKQFRVILEKLDKYRTEAVRIGSEKFTHLNLEELPTDQREISAVQKANLAAMLVWMNSGELVWPELKHQPDSRLRSKILHRLSTYGISPQSIIERFRVEPDISAKRSLLLCLGGIPQEKLPLIEKSEFVREILEVFRSHPDKGLHSAARWMLKQWGHADDVEEIEQSLRHTKENRHLLEEDQEWFINQQGLTFVIIDAGEFEMGSKKSLNSPDSYPLLHTKCLNRTFAIASHEMTRASWRPFALDRRVVQVDSESSDGKVFTDDSPMGVITWYEAARYCNWLSEQEGISIDQWCYEPHDSELFGPGMKAKENFWELSGYRLPTVSEWEFACRAGAVTPRHYGETDELLDQYAWYAFNAGNRANPVAQLLPNDFGLFDMHGNVWEWCYDENQDYPTELNSTVEDTPATDPVSETSQRTLRGGGYLNFPGYLTCTYRLHYLPNYRSNLTGFRPAKTIIKNTE